MTKPGREADDLGHMLAKMMAAQAAGAAAGAGAGAGAAPGAGPRAVPADTAEAEEEKDEVLNEYGTTRNPPSDEEAILETRPNLNRVTTNNTIRSVDELVEAEYAPVAPDLKSDDGHGR